MNKNDRFSMFFSLVMLFCVLAWIVYLPLSSLWHNRLNDLTLSLETSEGRERKQEHEYEEVLAELPQAEQQLAEIQPQADEALNTVAALKARRKELREAVRALQQESEAATDPALDAKEGAQP